MAKNFEDIVASLDLLTTALKEGARIVTCPLAPREIPGIVAAAYTAGDCIGTVFTLPVPEHGIIYSATYFDLSGQGLQVDLEIFAAGIASAGDNSAFAPTDAEILRFITELAFVTFDDHGTSRTSELTNIGKAYTAPAGKLHIQAVDRGGQTIAAVSFPRIQLQILSGDPNFKES